MSWLIGLLIDAIASIVCWVIFTFYKAIAWVLDMLTQLFFIFSGMTPIGTNSINAETGVDEGIDIVNYFLTQKAFQKAYLYLSLVALGLIVVFTIAKIIKQDYFDRSGPRSKGPIFRNVALSFIAFICVIPIFYFMIDIVGSLSLLIMKAMGYKGGGLGTMVFNLSWSDNGESFKALGEAVSSGAYADPDNFGWYPSKTFYQYFWNPSKNEVREIGTTFIYKDVEYQRAEFYWWMFALTGLILIVNLAKMLCTMVSRLYKLIALFVIAPSPISQIVLDEGQKFKIWKDNVLKEALKVVSCVMSFMLFMLIAGAVPNIDLMKFAYSPDAASAYNLLENNSLTAELSYSVDMLYYAGDVAGGFDKAINALGRAMILVAGVGAIQDMDTVIAPVLGGASAFDSGKTGGALAAAGGAVGKFAIDQAKKWTGTAAKAVTQLALGGAVGIEQALGNVASGAGKPGGDPASTGGTDEKPETTETLHAPDPDKKPNDDSVENPVDKSNDQVEDVNKNTVTGVEEVDNEVKDEEVQNVENSNVQGQKDEEKANDLQNASAPIKEEKENENASAAGGNKPEMSERDKKKANLKDKAKKLDEANANVEKAKANKEKKEELLNQINEKKEKAKKLEERYAQTGDDATLRQGLDEYKDIENLENQYNALGQEQSVTEAEEAREQAINEFNEARHDGDEEEMSAMMGEVRDELDAEAQGIAPQQSNNAEEAKPATPQEQYAALKDDAKKAEQELTEASIRNSKKNEAFNNMTQSQEKIDKLKAQRAATTDEKTRENLDKAIKEEESALKTHTDNFNKYSEGKSHEQAKKEYTEAQSKLNAFKDDKANKDVVNEVDAKEMAETGIPAGATTKEYGGTATGSESKTGGTATGASSTSAGNTGGNTYTKEGSGDTAGSSAGVQNGGNTGGNAGGSKPTTSSAGVSPLNTMGGSQKLSGRAKAAARGLAIASGTFGALKHGALPAAWTVAKSGMSTVGSFAKLLMQVTGMGAIADGVEDLGRGVIENTKKGVKKGAEKYFKRDANGNLVSNSKFIHGLAATGGAINAAKDWVANDGLSGMATRALSKKIYENDPGSSKVTKNEKEVLNNSNQNINNGIQTVNDITNDVKGNGGDISTGTRDVMNNTDNLISEASTVNNVQQQVTGQSDEQLKVTPKAVREQRKNDLVNAQNRAKTTKQNVETTRSNNETVKNVTAMNQERRQREVAETQTGKEWNDSINHKDTNKFSPCYEGIKDIKAGQKLNILQTYACKRGIARLADDYAKQYDGGKGPMKKDEYDKKMEELDKAYLHISGTGNMGDENVISKGLREQIVGSAGFDEISKGKKYSTSKPASVKQMINEQAEIENKFESGMKSRSEENYHQAVSENDKANKEVAVAQNKANDTTMMDDLIDAKEEYASRAKEYEEAYNNYQAAAGSNNFWGQTSARIKMKEAKDRLSRSGEKLSTASQNVTTRMTESYGNTKKVSAKNNGLNKDYGNVNTKVTTMNAGIERMKASGASATEIKQAEQTRDQVVNATNDAQSKGEKVTKKVKVKAKKAIKNIEKQAKAAEKMNDSKQQMGIGGTGKATDTTDLEVQVEYTPDQIESMCADGKVGPNLGAAYNFGISGSPTFGRSVNSVPGKCEIQMSDAELEKLIKEINTDKAKEVVENSNFRSVKEYKQDLKERYKTAGINYSQSIAEAKRAITEYNNGNGTNPESLARAQKAIAEAVQHSTNLRDIRVEIEKIKK